MFKTQCLQKGFMSGEKPFTHVLMDGGSLTVPFEHLDDFYELCAQQKDPIFVVEQKTPIYNYFLDIDYVSGEALELTDIEIYAQSIHQRVREFKDVPCIVSVAEPKPKGSKIKTGVHLNFPGLLVDKVRANYLMNHIIQHLSQIHYSIDWSKCIDPVVYGSLDTDSQGSGFRMIWSHKRNTAGKVESEYLPIMFLSGDKVESIPVVNPPKLELLKLTTVRTQNETPNVEIPELILKPSKKLEGGFTARQTKSEFGDYDLRCDLETFINKNLTGQSISRVLKIYSASNNNYLVSTDSKYCENLKRSHNSNHVWFFICGKDKTICQKCFCRCDTTEGRKHGYCKDFYGRKNQLTTKICEIIFPNTKKKVISSW